MQTFAKVSEQEDNNMPERHAGYFQASLGSMFRKPHPLPLPPSLYPLILYGMDHDPFKHKTLCSGIWGFYHMDP
jgi:hypothetical protein